MIKWFAILLCCSSLHAQTIIRGATIRSATLGTTNVTSGGGGASWTLVSHTIQVGTSGDTTTAAINTTGANFLVAVVAATSGNVPTLTSTLNASGWVMDTNLPSSHISIWHKASPSVGASDALTVGTVGGSDVAFWAFNKGSASGVFDTVSPSGTISPWNSGTLPLGTATPSTATDLAVGGGWFNVYTSGNDIPDSSFILPDITVFNSGSAIGLDAIYKIKSDSLAESPGLTRGVANNADAFGVFVFYK